MTRATRRILARIERDIERNIEMYALVGQVGNDE
jgi:hypothetical protein